MQALHYLTLSFIIPPLLAAFAEPASLRYEGGAANVGESIPARCFVSDVSHFNLKGWLWIGVKWLAGRP